MKELLAVASALFGLGLFSILTRRAILGILIGLQTMFLGGGLLLAVSGASFGGPVRGQVMALFVGVASLATLVCGYGLLVRLFYQSKKSDMGQINNLRH